MYRRVLLAVPAVLAVLSVAPHAQQQAAPSAPPPPDTPLPLDPKVTSGTLANGLRFYIRQNSRPEKRASLRLVVNAGSIHEDPDQLGYAHFVEHMAFNGTRNFPKNELVSYLQSIGVQFGAHLNASTSFDETVYMLTVPTDSAHILTTAFRVLADWAHGQLFDSAEVVNERGVVVEEWRAGKGAGERMQQKSLPIILKGSRYADRLPIGAEESIRAATSALLRRYYQDWYRPDLMAVVAVGDFDVATIERLIRQNFEPMPAARTRRPAPVADVPDNTQPLVAIATDHEATGSIVNVGFKQPRVPVRTVGDYRRSTIEGIYLSLINNRLYEVTRKPNAPFTGARMSMGGFFARDLNAFTIGASVEEGGIVRGLEAVLVEMRRADEFGFLESELQRAKQNLLRSYELSFNERATQSSAGYVGSYVSNFLFGSVYSGIEYNFPLVQQLIPTITLSEVNGLARRWITDDNRIILAQAPQKAGVHVPTEAELLAVFARAAAAPVVAYTENVADGPLVPDLPAPGRVVRERTIADVGVTEWTLSNGARVLIKQTEYRTDEILFTGGSDGGTSLADSADYISASLGTALVSGVGGVGAFTAVDLGKKLTGIAARARAGISAYGESVSGSAPPKDLETMLQLAYLRFTSPNLDTTVLQATRQQARAALANRSASPNAAFGDTIGNTMSQYHYRSQPPSAEQYDRVDVARALAFYKERFADAGDWTFAFVGNVSLPALKPLVEQYLASLPATGRNEKWREVTPGPPTGQIEKTVRKGSEARATTQMFFTGPFEYTPQNRFDLSALMALFQIKLVESLREQLGGTYSPGSSGSSGRIPRESYTISIGYPSAPENVEKLTGSVLALIDSLTTHGPTAADVDKVREQFTRSTEAARRTNSYWLASIASRTEPIDELAARNARSDEMVRNLTPAQIQAAARKYFDRANFARFILLPESVQ